MESDHSVITLVMVAPNLILSAYGLILGATDKIDTSFDEWFAFMTTVLLIHFFGAFWYCTMKEKARPFTDVVVLYFTVETLLLWIYDRGSKDVYLSRGGTLYGLHAASLFTDMLLLMIGRKVNVGHPGSVFYRTR